MVKSVLTYVCVCVYKCKNRATLINLVTDSSTQEPRHNAQFHFHRVKEQTKPSCGGKCQSHDHLQMEEAELGKDSKGGYILVQMVAMQMHTGENSPLGSTLITMPSHFKSHLLKLQSRKLKRMELNSIPVECLRNTTMKSGSLPS